MILPLTKSCLAGFNRRRPPLLLAEILAHSPADTDKTNLNAGGTYMGTPIGGTTGDDPALFGVFFSPTFHGTPANSINYRSDSGITPDPRTLASYSPSLNQPFFIGDGYNQNNAHRRR